MNSNSYIGPTQFSRRRQKDGVALVITLLMLSVITFLAVAFLAMSRRNQSAINASLDLTTARAMSEAAQARAQAEIMAQILASGDPLQYDYMVSRNFINPAGFYAKYKDSLNTTNVNYDKLANTATLLNNTSLQEDWVQNIANLYYDPRPPVFVNTNTNSASPIYDFRFYVDINRNGRFETNGYQPTITNESLNGFGPSAVLNGEPEFIGVLKNPLFHHSSSNQFVGRYAYLVLPVGKTLDLNYIHNFLKGSLEPGQMGQLTNNSVGNSENDGFARDQGIGSWELNLAGLLDANSPWAYESNNSQLYPFGRYDYQPPNLATMANTGLKNHGNAFDDAEAMLYYRYSPETAYALNTLSSAYPTNYLDFEDNLIDIYCANASLVPPFDYSGPANYPIATNTYKTLVGTPWSGSYQANMFFDVQDLFDPAKTSPNFTNRMILASQRTNTYDRYTFQRLISCIGMGSSPEYGVWVYDNFGSNTLRTKVNINYDNTAQITNANAPYAPMPTNLIPWKPTAFFNYAADLLLRSQPHIYPIYVSNIVSGLFTTNFFGVTNIPIYSVSNPGIKYDAGVHRLLQLAANIYDATQTNTYLSFNGSLRHPTIFRPLFNTFGSRGSNAVLYITGYAQVLNDGSAFSQMLLPYQDMSNVVNGNFHTNWNVAGIPWVVAADSGLPAFYHYTSGTQVLLTRKLLFPRQIKNGIVVTNQPPLSTNQFFCMAITNSVGMDGWNPYPTAFYGSGSHSLYYYYSNYVTIQLTNEYNFGTNIIVAASNYLTASTTPLGTWKAGGGPAKSSAGILSLFNSSNIVTLPESYYSESNHSFLSLVVTNGSIQIGSFRAGDMSQKSWPVYNWTINVSNHVVYGLFDGPPGRGTLLDFVNLGPFGATLSITNIIAQQGNNPLGMHSVNTPGAYWNAGAATSLAGSPMSSGVLLQINAGEEVTKTTFAADLIGSGGTGADAIISCPFNPTWIIQQPTNWVANDPLVHYTIEDLTWTGDTITVQKAYDYSSSGSAPPPPLTNSLGLVSARYSPWGSVDVFSNNMLLKDPLITRSSDWQFPTNKFPSVGWIGRVHRGTPWQTVFLKSDNSQSYALWSSWANPFWISGPNTSYPTNDWPLVDVFTTSPNDNAATGLLSVNQTNDPAWAAVFAGVIALTNINGGVQIMPNNTGNLYNFTNLMDGPLGINAQRANYPNGIFHKVGYILGAPALTVSNSFLAGPASQWSDEVIERIPQQTLSLLKVGEPQFVIFAWGQALKPKGPPFLGLGANGNTYTNYEITGEVLTRTVCHLVHTNGLKMVIDSYNVESGN